MIKNGFTYCFNKSFEKLPTHFKCYYTINKLKLYILHLNIHFLLYELNPPKIFSRIIDQIY